MDTKSYLRIYPTRGPTNPQYIRPDVGAAKYLNQIITKVKKYLDNYYLILGDFNLGLSTLNTSSKHNISKETRSLHDTLEQIDFTDIYRTLHPN